MKIKLPRFVYRPTLSKSGQWNVRKVKFSPNRFDAYSTHAKAKIICERYAHNDRLVAADKVQQELIGRLKAALSSLTLEELGACRDLTLKVLSRF